MFINKIYSHMDIDLEIGVDLQKESITTISQLMMSTGIKR